MVNLPGNRGSCWVATADRTGYPQLDSSVHAETVVVGGGIVGLTTALRLLEAGRSVILVEALEIGQQVTGRSTAKITTQHALIYRHLVDTCGLPTARNYTEANSAGVELIKDWIREYGIACDLECKNAYSYATNSKGREEIEAEAEAARQVGLQAEVLDRAPLPFETVGALCFADQAQFNPAKYLVGLAHTVANRGGRLFEHSRAILIGEASRWRVVTAYGTVHAENMVVATNMTVKSPVGMANRTQPRCHTAMAFRVDDPLVVDGMSLMIPCTRYEPAGMTEVLCLSCWAPSSTPVRMGTSRHDSSTWKSGRERTCPSAMLPGVGAMRITTRRIECLLSANPIPTTLRASTSPLASMPGASAMGPQLA